MGDVDFQHDGLVKRKMDSGEGSGTAEESKKLNVLAQHDVDMAPRERRQPTT